MKSKRLFCLFLAVILVFSLLGINAFADETYSFTTKGFGGDVTVTLTAIDGKITSLTATGPNESTDFGAKGIVYFNKLFSVYEGTELSQFDTSTIDAYTGATTTSNAVFTALNSVLAEVAESSTDASLADGTYTEMEWGFSLDTQLPVTVEIKNGAIASVTADLENGGETTHIARTAVERMIPRIIEEQSLSVDAITGATSSSNAIKNGISDALKEAMIAGGMAEKEAATALSGWYKVPSYMKTDDEPVDIQTQVVVVGGGGTGCLAAIQAQKTGADTLVIEKSGKYGGTGALTCGPLTINSPAQVEEFGNRDLVDADMLYTQWLEDIGAEEDSVNAEIISDFMGMSGYDIDWMDSMGFRKLIAATPFKFPAYQVWSTYDGWNSGKVHGDGNTHDFFDDLMKLYTNLGGKTMFETTGTAFLLDEVGKVIGVEAEGFDGQIYHIYADAVVLATGGYAGSSEYLKEFTLSDDTGVYQTYGIMTNVGTAISMARQVDGRISDNVDIVMAHFSAPEKRIHAFDPADNEIPTSIIVNEAMLDVDTNGDRFINETFASSDAGDETNRYLTIIGSDQIDAIKAEGFIGTTSGMYLNPGQISPGMPVENIYSVLDFCINAGFVWKADNLDDLAAAISADTGMPMSNLVSSVERYNEICAAGEDVDFGKDAAFLQPVTGNIYYAVEATPILYSTCSSVDVDASLRLLTNSGKPIENVFIGGVDSMGMVLSDEYIDYGGVAQSWAFYSGRLCGMNAAEYVINGTVPEADESYTITELGENTYNIIGTAPYMPACTLTNGDLPENGLNYVELTLPADSEAVTAVVRTITPYAGDFAVTEPNTEVPVTEGNFSYFLQINDSTVTAGGVVLGVEFDNGTTAEYTINTDFLTLAGNETSEDITVATNEAAAADPALNFSKIPVHHSILNFFHLI